MPLVVPMPGDDYPRPVRPPDTDDDWLPPGDPDTANWPPPYDD